MRAHRLRRPAAAGTLIAMLVLVPAVAGCGGSASGSAPVTSPGASATSSAAPSLAAPVAPGIPRTLARESRPIGHGAAFHPSARGPVLGSCRPRAGRRDGVHVELFAANRVVLIAAGIGTRPARRDDAGRVVAPRCFGALATRQPTGVVLVRPRARLTIGDLFRSWGRSLTSHRLLSFRGRVTAYVGGRRWTRTAPGEIPLTRHAEIVLEVGPHVPPHRRFDFPPGS